MHIYDAGCLRRYVLLLLTEGVPSHVTAMTGIVTLIKLNAIEAYSALNATPFTDSLAIGAIAMNRSIAAESGGLRCIIAREHVAGFMYGGNGVYQRRAWVSPPRDGASARGGAYSARSGERHVAANDDEFNRMVCRDRF